MSDTHDKPLTALKDAFREVWLFRGALIITHLTARLLSAALIVPFAGILLALGIRFSDQSALTDQDIAWFILSPAGLAAFLLIFAVLFLAAVLDVAVMTGVLHSCRQSPMTGLRIGLHRTFARLPLIIGFAVRLILRVLLMALPFAIIGLGIAWFLLTEFDINYYLSNSPPEFKLAIGLIGVLGLGLALLLLRASLDWALSLHLILFEKCAPREVFLRSKSMMAGKRRGLVMRLLLWLVVRVGVGFGIAALFGVLVGAAIPETLDNIRRTLVLLFAVFGLWAVVDAVFTAMTTGAVASMLYWQYVAARGDVPPRDFADRAPPVTRIPIWAMVAAAGTAVAVGIGTGAAFMDSIKPVDEVEIIAHRGAAGVRPENTLASVEKALEDKTDWVEIDVQETADGEVVVVHDSDFMKTARNPLKVWDATMPVLADIDIGSWYGPEYADQRTPTLRQVLEMAKGKAKVIIELKYYGHDEMLEQRVSDIIDSLDMADQVAIMSLKYPAVQKMRALRPDLRSGILAATAIGNLSGLEADFLAVNLGLINGRLIRSAHSAGQDVYAWTVNDPLTMSSLISQGVDGLITDDPAMVHQVLAHRAELSTPERLMLVVAERLGVAVRPREIENDRP